MQFEGYYSGNPPALWKDMRKIDLMKTMKKKFGMRDDFTKFPELHPIGSSAPDFTLETPTGERVSALFSTRESGRTRIWGHYLSAILEAGCLNRAAQEKTR